MNFTDYEAKWPTYINVARDPVDLFASKFYFSRYSCVGCKVNRHHSNEIETIEDCIKNNESECTGTISLIRRSGMMPGS